MPRPEIYHSAKGETTALGEDIEYSQLFYSNIHVPPSSWWDIIKLLRLRLQDECASFLDSSTDYYMSSLWKLSHFTRYKEFAPLTSANLSTLEKPIRKLKNWQERRKFQWTVVFPMYGSFIHSLVPKSKIVDSDLRYLLPNQCKHTTKRIFG